MKNGFSTDDVFTLALGLNEPWIVKDVQLLPGEKNPETLEMHITIDFRKGSTHPCPVCGIRCAVHDTTERTWRHLNFFQYRCYIHAKVPRTTCDEHGVKSVPVPWVWEGSGFMLFE